MWWLIYALLAHVMNAGVFVVDKSLLSTDSKISSPVRYAAWSGILATGSVVLLPFSYVAPTWSVTGWSIVAGILWVAALWSSFAALKIGDPTVVVPITGSVVPIFTWLMAVSLLGEQLNIRTVVAMLILVLGGAVLSLKLDRAARTGWSIIGMAVLSGLFFAGYFAVVKHLYIVFPFFVAAFAYSRIGVGVAAMILFIFLRKEKLRKRTSSSAEQGKKLTMVIIAAIVVSKGLGMTALILQNYAISLGSVTVVNALQGTQYVFLLGLAALVSHRFPSLWREVFSRVTLLQKIFGIGLVSVGLVLLVA